MKPRRHWVKQGVSRFGEDVGSQAKHISGGGCLGTFCIARCADQQEGIHQGSQESGPSGAIAGSQKPECG